MTIEREATAHAEGGKHEPCIPKRGDGVRDIKSSAGYLVQIGLANPKRLGITGGSYGGS